MKRTPLAKRRNVTLIEMMIVMFLIALITGVIAYNYRGSLDEGKAFKTQQAISRIENILNLKLAEDPSLADNIEHDWKGVVANSPMVQNPSAFMKDGWGGDYRVTIQDNVLHVTSDKYDQYKNKTAH